MALWQFLSSYLCLPPFPLLSDFRGIIQIVRHEEFVHCGERCAKGQQARLRRRIDVIDRRKRHDQQTMKDEPQMDPSGFPQL